MRTKKFDLVHQTVSPRERVGSGDETDKNGGLRTLSQSCHLGMDTRVDF